MFNLFSAAQLLAKADVEFVIVGGLAVRSHGGNYMTDDLDICYSPKDENLKKIAEVLGPLEPRPRGLADDLPYIFDWTTLRQGTNFTFRTTLGDIDLLGEVSGVGIYEDLLKDSVVVDLEGLPVRILSINGLIKAKEAAGRGKDEEGLKVLYALRESEQGSDE
jgi:predicted nucleotidyltransferase